MDRTPSPESVRFSPILDIAPEMSPSEGEDTTPFLSGGRLSAPLPSDMYVGGRDVSPASAFSPSYIPAGLRPVETINIFHLSESPESSESEEEISPVLSGEPPGEPPDEPPNESPNEPPNEPLILNVTFPILKIPGSNQADTRSTMAPSRIQSRLEDLNKQLNESNRELSQLRESDVQLRRKVMHLGADILGLREKRDSYRDKRNYYKEQGDAYKEDVEHLKEEIARKANEVEVLNNNLTTFRNRCQTMSEVVSAKDKQIELLQSRQPISEEELAELRHSVLTFHQYTKELEDKQKKQDESLDDLTKGFKQSERKYQLKCQEAAEAERQLNEQLNDLKREHATEKTTWMEESGVATQTLQGLLEECTHENESLTSLLEQEIADCSELRAQQEQLETERSRYKDIQRQLDSVNAERNTLLSDLNTKNLSMLQQSKQYEESLSATDKLLTNERTLSRSLQGKLQTTGCELEEKAKLLREKSDKVAELERKQQQLEQELNQSLTDVQAVRREAEEISATCKKLRAESEQQESQYHSLQGELDKANRELAEKDKQLQAQNARVSELELQRKRLKVELDQKQTAVQTTQREAEELAATCETLRIESDERKSRLITLEKEKVKTEESLSSVQQELAAHRKQHDQLVERLMRGHEREVALKDQTEKDLEDQLQKARESGTKYKQLLLDMESILSTDEIVRDSSEIESEEDLHRLDWFVRDVSTLAGRRPEIRALFNPREPTPESPSSSQHTQTAPEVMTDDFDMPDTSGFDRDSDFGMSASPGYQPSEHFSDDESDVDDADESGSESARSDDLGATAASYRTVGIQAGHLVSGALKDACIQTEGSFTETAEISSDDFVPGIKTEPCLWTCEHLSSCDTFFGEKTAEEQELAGILGFLAANPKDKKARWSRWKDMLQDYGVAVPKWPEFQQTEKWTDAMVRYAAVRLGKAQASVLIWKDFKELNPHSTGYFFAFVHNFKDKTEFNITNYTDSLNEKKVPIPQCGIFNTGPAEWTPSPVNFLMWCSQNKDFTTVRLRGCTASVSPSILMYRALVTEYALKIMGKSSSDESSVTYDDETNKKIQDKVSSMNLDKAGVSKRIPVPDNVVGRDGSVVKQGLRRGRGVWTSDCFKIVLNEGLSVVSLQPAKDKFSVFEDIRRSAHLKDLEAYKGYLKQAMEFYPGDSLRQRVQAQKKITKTHSYKCLHPIEGTTIGEIEMEPAGFLLSCLYHHGFKHFKKEHIYTYSGRMLKLIKAGAVDKEKNPEKDERLKEIVDQLLVLKLSAYQNDKPAYDELQKIQVFKSWELNIKTVGELRRSLPPVKWVDNEETTGEYVETNRGAVMKAVAAGKKRVATDEAGPSTPAKKAKTKATSKPKKTGRTKK